jgi:NAD(P)-dependent dehydrogenase (short-subunit alcohol dehydrogenase family)
MELKGLAAIVTGGHSGMGFAAAHALAARGCKVSILGRRRERLEQKASQIGAQPIACDVADPAAVEAAAHEAERAHGVARILVHAAADGRMHTLLAPDDTPNDLGTLQQIVATNLLGTLYVAREFAARLARAPILDGGLRGVLINVSSIGAPDGAVGATYAATKGGVESLGLSLARELGPRRIRVVTIAPGGIDTEMLRAGAVEGTYEALRTMVPALGRAGRPDEFAGLVVHICENDYLNGCTIRLDGGMRIPYSFDLGGGMSSPGCSGDR